MGDSPVFLYLRRGMRARSVTVHVGTFGGRLKALRTFVAASLIPSLPLILQSGGASAAGVAIRIDTGSAAAYTDSAGRTWQADRSFVGGATTANAIRTGPTGTADPALFKTMRYGKDFSYAIPVSTAGTYLLRLHTAELNFSTPGSRQFTINAEGKPVTADLDLAKAPGIRAPWTLEVPVTVTDGTLNLRFLAALDYAQISGIEIIRKVDPYQLVWSDEFDGTSVDTTKWNVRNNWAAKNEIAIDTNRPANVVVSNGVLTIRSLREQRTVGSATRQFTSGYLDTIGKQSWTYGRFSMRAQLATQQGTSKGIWPAFWMRPDDGGVGEIDIMEAIGSDATGTEWNKTHQTIHHDYNVTVPAQENRPAPAFPAGASPSDGFHTYTVEWSPVSMTWSIDGAEVWRRDRTTTSWFDQAFARPFNIRLNQRVGGSWAGAPTTATVFPADYRVDWIRVHQRP